MNIKDMKKNHKIGWGVSIFAVLFVVVFGGFQLHQESNTDNAILQTQNNSIQTNNATNNTVLGANISLTSVEGSVLDTSELFTEKDLEQSAVLSGASYIELSSGEDIIIAAEGVYVLSGDVKNVTVIIEVGDEDKVQLVLDNVNIINDDSPAIYVKSADKVFITLTDSNNYMEVSGTYKADGDTNLDAAIFSREDIVFNGIGTLNIVSAKGNGITSKDDLKVTGGTYSITSLKDGLEANDSIRIAGGSITIDSKKDALHSENEDDLSLGYIYIADGTLNISAIDDAMRGTSIVQIDGGVINIKTCLEGIEGTYVQINGGEIDIYARDDGINAVAMSSYDVVIEVNGGIINVEVQGGDVDGFDSNGGIIINGGIVNVVCPTQAPSGAFDSIGTAQLNGGTVTVNGEVITEITVTPMGGGMPGGRRMR
jgi:hypothetical protein